MKNTTKNAILAAVRNVDDATYEKTIKWWANDAIGSFGEYLLKIWSNYHNRSMGELYCCRKVEDEILDWFASSGVESSAEYCLKCLNILTDNQAWDDYSTDEDNSEETVSSYEVAEEILSWIIGDITTEIVEWLETRLNENNT